MPRRRPPEVPGGTFVFTRQQGQYVAAYLAPAEGGVQPIASHGGTILVATPVDRFFSTGSVDAYELGP